MIQTIRVEVLRRLSVWADDTPILQAAAKINKPWQVFCYLLINRGAPTAPSQLIEALWGQEDLIDPGNVLKNTVYALRREFKRPNSTAESVILFENGGYICNPAIRFEVDADAFSLACSRAAQASGDEKLALLKEATSLYKGDFLPQLEGEVWAIAQTMMYRGQYARAMQELLSMLQKKEHYSELLAEAIAANWVDPLEETYYLYMFRAMYELGMYRAIIPAFHKTSRTFVEELGAPLNDEIRRIYQKASEKVNQTEQDIMLIKQELQDASGDGPEVKGPLYCTYDVFKYLYQMVARISRRSGQHIIILLVSLQTQSGDYPPAKLLSAAMSQVRKLILGGLLRQTDTMARYSRSQYIIMLSTTQPIDSNTVIDRLHKKCRPLLAAHGMKMVFAKTELSPDGPGARQA